MGLAAMWQMKVNPLKTSAARLGLGFGAIFTLGVSVLLGAIWFLTDAIIEKDAVTVVTAEMDGLTDEYLRGGLAGLQDELNKRADSWGRTGVVYLLVDAGLVKVGGNLDAWPASNQIPQGDWAQFSIKARRGEGDAVELPVRAHLLDLPDGYRLLVGLDVTQQRGFSRTFLSATLWGIGLTALAGAVAGYILSRRLTRRVQNIAETCDVIVGGDLSQRLPISGLGDEFDTLSQAVNHMVARLGQKTQLLRATFDSAAHDLRAPLYRLRGRLEEVGRMPMAEPAVRAGIEAALQNVDRVQRTLAMLLQIAQAESGVTLTDAVAVDLAQLARDMVDLFEPAAMQRRMALRARVAEGPTLARGNRQLLAQLVTNLVENALKYCPEGTNIEIGARAMDDHVELWVADDGPGIAATDIDAALQPFVRLSPAQGQDGSGLGLSLVAAIARLHQARLQLLDNAPGLRVVLSLK